MKKIVFTSVCSVLFFFSCSQDSKLKKIIAEDLFEISIPEYMNPDKFEGIVSSVQFSAPEKGIVKLYVIHDNKEELPSMGVRYSNEEIFKANAENESALLANAKISVPEEENIAYFNALKGFVDGVLNTDSVRTEIIVFEGALRFYTMVISYKVSEYSKIKKDIKQIPETFKEATEFKAGKTEEE